ncbi:LPXTG cell wall anchor domain-containing protein [Staphylococcus capitis]
MKNNKPRDLKQFPSLPSKKYFSYGTASALTLALYLFAGNGSAQAEDNNATNSNTSPKTIQTESDKTNTTTANNVTHKSTKNLNDYIDGTPNEDPDEEEDSGTYEVPILYVTVWLDDKGNIIKDAVEDDKTSKNQRGVIQISGYKYIKTVTEDGITKHIYKKVELKQEKKTSEVTKVKNNITKRMEDNKEKTSQNQKNSEKELPETGVKEQSFNPALLMLLAGLGLIGIFRNKIKE